MNHLVAIFVLLLISKAASAQQVMADIQRILRSSKTSVKHYLANLNSGQEQDPGCESEAIGNAYFYVLEGVLCYSISFKGLEGDFTLAHLHGPALPGMNSGVLIDFMPDLSKSFLSGCIPLSKENEAALNAGLTYINIHSDFCPGGEIRGQVVPSFKTSVNVHDDD